MKLNVRDLNSNTFNPYIEPIFCLNAYLSHYRNQQLSDYLVDLQFEIPVAPAAL